MDWYCVKNSDISTIRSRMTGRPGRGLKTIRPGRSFRFVMHASPLLPLMFIASDPQTPSRQERRKPMESSMPMRWTSRSSSILSPGATSTSNACMYGAASLSGSYR
ncbi:hypothetical protein D9M68_940270 [compost metagenome]